MLITIKESKESWKSPDGQRTIWDIKDSEGNTWQTMSHQIASALGQTLDLTTRVSDKGKTYLIKPPQEEPGEAPQRADSATLNHQDIQGFATAVERFDRAVDKFAGTTPKDTVLEDLPPVSLYDEQIGDIVDDLT